LEAKVEAEHRLHFVIYSVICFAQREFWLALGGVAGLRESRAQRQSADPVSPGNNMENQHV
jgi:hypothetical protein